MLDPVFLIQAKVNWQDASYTNIPANLQKDFLQLGLQYRFNLRIVGIEPNRLETKGKTRDVLHHVGMSTL